MPRSCWLIVIAFGIALVASLGQAQEQPQSEQGRADEQNSPAQSLPIPVPVVIVEDQASADARERREQEAAQREIDDLAAQQGMNAATQAMNDATQRMADFAYVQTWLIGTGTALLFVTLWLTRQANNAAQEAVKVTRELGEAQARAYLHFSIPQNVVERLDLVFKVANFGASPAELSVNIEMHVIRRGRVIYSEPVTFLHKIPEMCGVGQSNSYPAEVINLTELLNEYGARDINEGGFWVETLATIVTRDVFGLETTTTILSRSEELHADEARGQLSLAYRPINKISETITKKQT